MKFLVDAQLPPSLATWLTEHGHEALHVAMVGSLAASDRSIADACEREARVLVSKEEDFLILRLPDRFALLWLRIGDATDRTPIA